MRFARLGDGEAELAPLVRAQGEQTAIGQRGFEGVELAFGSGGEGFGFGGLACK